MKVPFSKWLLTERVPSHQKDITILFGQIFKRSLQTLGGLSRSSKCFATLLETLVTYAHPEILPNTHVMVTIGEKSTLTGRRVRHFVGTVLGEHFLSCCTVHSLCDALDVSSYFHVCDTFWHLIIVLFIKIYETVKGTMMLNIVLTIFHYLFI